MPSTSDLTSPSPATAPSTSIDGKFLAPQEATAAPEGINGGSINGKQVCAVEPGSGELISLSQL